MRLFVVTTGTKDYGAAFVVREHRSHDGHLMASVTPLAVCGTLEEACGAIEEWAPSLVRLAPSRFDDNVIVESWGSQADVDASLLVQHALETGSVLVIPAREPKSACPYDAGVGEVMSNFDHSVDPEAERLLSGDAYGRHSAWNFNARVWLDKSSGEYKSEVWQHGAPVKVLSAPTLKEVMHTANDQFGWD